MKLEILEKCAKDGNMFATIRNDFETVDYVIKKLAKLNKNLKAFLTLSKKNDSIFITNNKNVISEINEYQMFLERKYGNLNLKI